mgnify:CR=1 FL=1
MHIGSSQGYGFFFHQSDYKGVQQEFFELSDKIPVHPNGINRPLVATGVSYKPDMKED